MAEYTSQYTGKQIDEAVGNATKVVANPADAGTVALESIEIAGDVYNIPKTPLYEHHISLYLSSDENYKVNVSFSLISTVQERFTDIKSVASHLGDDMGKPMTASGQLFSKWEITDGYRIDVVTAEGIDIRIDSSEDVRINISGFLTQYETKSIKMLSNTVDVMNIGGTAATDYRPVDATNIAMYDIVRTIY